MLTIDSNRSQMSTAFGLLVEQKAFSRIFYQMEHNDQLARYHLKHQAQVLPELDMDLRRPEWYGYTFF